MRVWVSGMGLISALGRGSEKNLASLEKEQSGIGKAQHLKSRYSETMCFGEYGASDKELLEWDCFPDDKKLTRTDLLSFIAVKEAIDQADLQQKQLSDFSTALISASTVGGMCLTDAMYNDANALDDHSEYVQSYSLDFHTRSIAEYFKIHGYTDTINTACSSSANAIMLGMKLIQAGKAKRAIVGGVDALAKFTVNGFNALQILSDQNCMPFDENRTGLNLGEGAAYLILESEEVIGDKKPIAELTGYGNANDAFHPSTLSADAVGVVQAMQSALKKAALDPSKIDYINAHGTATKNNDEVEYTGFEKIFGQDIPAYNSTKSFTGHTLGAAGSLEACFSIMSMQNNLLFPTLNHKQLMETAESAPITALNRKNIDAVMSNSFGFAGNCTSLIFQKPNN